jgi:hypothetical protein
MKNTNTFCFISISNLKTGRFETRRFETWRFVNLTFCKSDVLKPDVLKPDVLKPDVLKPDVLWVYLSVDLNFLEQCWDERKTEGRKKSSHSNINKNQSTNLNNYTTLTFPLMQILLEKGASLPQNPQKNLINILLLKVTLGSVLCFTYSMWSFS